MTAGEADDAWEGPAPVSRSATELLRAHAERILLHSAVPASEWADIAEELYGHLWQRWRDHVAAGATDEAAAQSAILAFGVPGEISPQLTRAYHSRLYASTIGVLLPAVAPAPDRPRGFDRLRLFLIAVAISQLITGAFLVAILSPVRGAVIGAAALLSAAICVIAARALALRQPWALEVARVAVVAAIVSAVVQLYLHPITVSVVGVVGVVALGPAFGRRVREWLGESDRVGPRLRAGVAAVLIGGFLLPAAAAVMPDPSEASASDLSLTVSLECTSDSYGILQVAVHADVIWRRTDIWPNGPLDVGSNRDELALWVDDGSGAVASASDNTFGFTPDGGLNIPAWALHPQVIDYAPDGPKSTDPPFDGPAFVTGWSSPANFPASGPLADLAGPDVALEIQPETLQAGHRYRVNWFGGPFRVNGPGVLKDMVVQYNHLGRWGEKAVVACGGSTTATPVNPPFTFP